MGYNTTCDMFNKHKVRALFTLRLLSSTGNFKRSIAMHRLPFGVQQDVLKLTCQPLSID